MPPAPITTQGPWRPLPQHRRPHFSSLSQQPPPPCQPPSPLAAARTWPHFPAPRDEWGCLNAGHSKGLGRHGGCAPCLRESYDLQVCLAVTDSSELRLSKCPFRSPGSLVYSHFSTRWLAGWVGSVLRNYSARAGGEADAAQGTKVEKPGAQQPLISTLRALGFPRLEPAALLTHVLLLPRATTFLSPHWEGTLLQSSVRGAQLRGLEPSPTHKLVNHTGFHSCFPELPIWGAEKQIDAGLGDGIAAAGWLVLAVPAHRLPARVPSQDVHV